MSETPVFKAVMRLDEVAKLTTYKPRSILNSLHNGTFLPLPFAERPLRWRGEDMEKWYRGEYREALERLRKDHRRRSKAA